MKKPSPLIYIFAPTLLVLTGCSLLGTEDEGIERTLLEAFNLESTTIQQLRNEVLPPDLLNIEVYVLNVIACPEGATCIIPDGIIISESLNPASQEDQFFLSVNEPEQFENENQYLFSIEVRGNESENRKFFNILGYTLAVADN